MHSPFIQAQTLRALVALTAAALSIVAAPRADAQIQPFLNARDPFIWDGVAGHALLGAEESSISISAASIVRGLYGEFQWDIEGLLGKGRHFSAQAPSFLFKFIPVHSVTDSDINHLMTVSIGTRALSGVDIFAGWGTYLKNGRFALGLGADMSWDRLENGGLSSTPTSRWILRTYAMLTPNLGFDSATTMHEEDDHISADVALIYRLFAPRFHLYMALIDVFSGQVDRRFGISYAIGVS